MKNFLEILQMLIEKEEEDRQKARDNWTISEYAYHDGKLNAYKYCYTELKKHYASILSNYADL